jgi:hypothetical protein
MKCLYLVTRSLDPTGVGRPRWMMRWKPALNAFAISFGDLPGGRNLLMETAGNTASEIVPMAVGREDVPLCVRCSSRP